MIYTFLISVVFIAEIIIALTVLINLIKLDKAVLKFDETVCLFNSKIKDIGALIKGISSQVYEIIESRIRVFKDVQDEVLAKTFVKTMLGILLWKMNIKTINKIRRSKFAKTLGKGLSLLEIVV